MLMLFGTRRLRNRKSGVLMWVVTIKIFTTHTTACPSSRSPRLTSNPADEGFFVDCFYWHKQCVPSHRPFKDATAKQTQNTTSDASFYFPVLPQRKHQRWRHGVRWWRLWWSRQVAGLFTCGPLDDVNVTLLQEEGCQSFDGRKHRLQPLIIYAVTYIHKSEHATGDLYVTVRCVERLALIAQGGQIEEEEDEVLTSEFVNRCNLASDFSIWI